MMRAPSVLIWLGAGTALVTAIACRAQPDSLAAAAATPLRSSAIHGDATSTQLADVPIGPLPGEPESGVRDPGNPFGDDPVALIEGRRLFNAFNCAGCHGDHGGGGMGPSLRDQRWIYGSSDAKIANSIAEGRANGMPAWGTKLTNEQTWKLATYIKSMRTSHEPDAPPGS
jgi:cytochrome c oxidase cbb3-type subunit 3